MIAAVLLRLFYLIWHVLGPVPCSENPAPARSRRPTLSSAGCAASWPGAGAGVPAQPADHDAIERGVGLAIARRG